MSKQKHHYNGAFNQKGKEVDNNRSEENKDFQPEVENNEQVTADEPEDVEVADVAELDSENETEKNEAEILKLNQELEEEKKKYLYLYAEFDNYRKRTVKDKSELIKNGTASFLKGLMPIVDDFERALSAMRQQEGSDEYLKGVELIYNNLMKYLQQNGVKEFGAKGEEFNPDIHEAIAVVPVTDDSQKNKIIDTIQKGYTVNDKMIRPAKVAVGQK